MKLDVPPKIIESTKVEQVAPQKLEYKLVGSYFRTKGLSLYCYNQLEDTVSLVVETIPTKVKLVVKPLESCPKYDYVTYEEYEHKSVEVDTRFYYFEALNLISATNRVNKWKQGLIKSLDNLKPFVKGKIQFF